MRIDEYSTLDAIGLAELIRRGDVSRADLARAGHAAFSAAHATLNCAVEVEPLEACLARAEVAPDGPFAGVPFAFKDLGAHPAYGLQEYGSRLCKGLPVEHATWLGDRFEASGVVSLGRTTVPEFGYNTATETVACGPTRNPFDLTRSPGGSSGGSAAAVAAGALPMAHANDGGGSIRIPAAYCGLVGLKPGRGRVSSGPEFAEGLNGLGVEHVVTRTVRDSAAMLDATAVAAPGDPYVLGLPSKSYLAAASRDPTRLRIGLITESWAGGWAVRSESVSSALEAGRLCESMGHIVEPATLEIDAEAFLVATARLWCSTLATWTKAITQATGRVVDATTLEGAMLACHAYGASLTAIDLQEAFVAFNAVSRAVGPLFERFDVLLTPATAGPAPKLGELSADRTDLDALGWTAHLFGPAPFTSTFNATGHPAISLPFARSREGLPVGIQLVARHNHEATLISLAGAIERAKPWSYAGAWQAAQPSKVAALSADRGE
ncbi:MAG: amidase family protein [Caulobacteraceae bacterium]|nr:MAG: amidase family protein [Caulobacteraceae bacterium]